jgi:hypothetical protein
MPLKSIFPPFGGGGGGGNDLWKPVIGGDTVVHRYWSIMIKRLKIYHLFIVSIFRILYILNIAQT